MRAVADERGEIEFSEQRMAGASFTLFSKIKFLPRNAKPEDEEIEYA